MTVEEFIGKVRSFTYWFCCTKYVCERSNDGWIETTENCIRLPKPSVLLSNNKLIEKIEWFIKICGDEFIIEHVEYINNEEDDNIILTV